MDRIAHIENMLIEILAIKLYEHDASSKKWLNSFTTSWNACDEETRQLYRDVIIKSNNAEDWITPQ